jgi:phosphate transport system substrate-binding protein
MIPGIAEFLHELSSDKAWGDEGYLADKGLIPMPEEERIHFVGNVRQLRANLFSSND